MLSRIRGCLLLNPNAKAPGWNDIRRRKRHVVCDTIEIQRISSYSSSPCCTDNCSVSAVPRCIRSRCSHAFIKCPISGKPGQWRVGTARQGDSVSVGRQAETAQTNLDLVGIDQ